MVRALGGSVAVSKLSYALITPACNEADNLPRLARAVAAQTLPPAAWLVIENGSSDSTHAVAQELARAYECVSVIRLPQSSIVSRGAPVVHAFKAGLKAVSADIDVIVKVDADVTFDGDYFEHLLRAFASEPELGIAGGAAWELENGRWRIVRTPRGMVRGAVRAYRRACLVQVLPLLEDLLTPGRHVDVPIAWDGLDVLKANLHGWRTETLPNLGFRHYRREGERDGRFGNWIARGRASHFMGYRPTFVLARSLYRTTQDPAALAMIWGYALGALRGDRRLADAELLRYVRDRQRLRRISGHIRDAA